MNELNILQFFFIFFLVSLLSFLGMTATFITVLTVIVLSFTDYYGLTPEDSTNTYGSHTFFNSSGIAAAFGSITVAFGGASVVCDECGKKMKRMECFLIFHFYFILINFFFFFFSQFSFGLFIIHSV